MHNSNESHHDHGGIEKQKKGISSFEMQDSEIVFEAIALKAGDCFVDLGYGAGDYAIHAAEAVGQSGIVYALDRWPELADTLSQRAAEKNLENVRPLVCDISGPLPIDDNVADVCFMANVLHGFNLATDSEALFSKIHRILKPGGRVSILEFKKADESSGPPKHVRISAEEIAGAIKPLGFELVNVTDFGRTYLAQCAVV